MRGVDVSDQKRIMVSADLQKMMEIYITFCPKRVSCELFHLI